MSSLLLELLPELLEIIVTMLSDRDFLSLTKTCHRMRLLNYNERVWQDRYLRAGCASNSFLSPDVYRHDRRELYRCYVKTVPNNHGCYLTSSKELRIRDGKGKYHSFPFKAGIKEVVYFSVANNLIFVLYICEGYGYLCFQFFKYIVHEDDVDITYSHVNGFYTCISTFYSDDNFIIIPVGKRVAVVDPLQLFVGTERLMRKNRCPAKERFGFREYAVSETDHITRHDLTLDIENKKVTYRRGDVILFSHQREEVEFVFDFQ